MRQERTVREFSYAPGQILAVAVVGPEDELWRAEACYRCAILLEGRAQLRVEGEGEAALYSNDVFQLFAGEGGDLLSPPGQDTLFFVAALPGDTGKAMRRVRVIQSARAFPTEPQMYLENWMPHLLTQLRDTPEDKLFEAWLSLQRFVAHLHRAAVPRDKAARMERAKQEIMNICCQMNPDMARVGEMLGMKMETFRKRFKRAAGASPGQFLLACRFQRAGHFLQSGMSVRDTAEAVGYRDPFVFSRQFKRHTGLSPSQWGKEHRPKPEGK